MRIEKLRGGRRVAEPVRLEDRLRLGDQLRVAGGPDPVALEHAVAHRLVPLVADLGGRSIAMVR